MEHPKVIRKGRCMGGVIRDIYGKIIHLYVVSIGNTTNNAAEFRVLE
jgi:hypothetical protein